MEDTENTKIVSDPEPDIATASAARLRDKRRRALKITGQHTVANSMLAFMPIPFSDAPFLVVSEGVLVARILLAYDMDRTLGSLTGILASVGGTLISSVGVMAAGNLIKLIPGAGTLVGGLINAAVAGTFTGALGLATIGVSEHTLALSSQGRKSDLETFLHEYDQELDDALRRAFNQAKMTNPYFRGQEDWA